MLMEMYSKDHEFKRFLGKSLVDKLNKYPNLGMSELMSSINMTLDLVDLRKEILRISLNQET